MKRFKEICAVLATGMLVVLLMFSAGYGVWLLLKMIAY